MVVRVSPDSIGPVRVRAHIGPEGVRVELLGATEQAREALKVALPDLRRDLIAAGLPADISLGTGRQQSTGTDTGWGGNGPTGDPQGRERRPAAAPTGAGAPAATVTGAPRTGASGLGGLDITV
ncbi:flagellar hook-length control protein FliK [Cellulomonas sp. ATA003]|uniref:flagellar hook-length control protein FliK n=1 Tax=Cellulomonas sp. ATA003 TaxID=3073064 RepID=UPI002872F1FD|nr:flagellar hook-length control protein FliK [Cellulomonas sp. ATA003]WNB85239.1 flagellar hook-length control protein FliK [Cellulomonas sp. ATA003]